MPFVSLDQLVRRSLVPPASGPLRCVVTARVVFEGFGTPRQDAAVALFEASPGELVVTEFGPREAVLASHPGAPVVDAGLAVSPAPVNAHTHLDLSDMPFTPGTYEAFIAAVIAHGRSGARGLPAARRGVAEVKAAGTRVVGDVVTDPDVMTALLEDPDLTGVAYWEVLGPDPAAADELFRRAVDAVSAFRALERPGGVRVGVSPHTPHTVSAPLMRSVTGWARTQGVPVAIHVAETPAERELHLRGTGSLAASLAAAGLRFVVSGVSPVRYLHDLGALQGGPTLVHMVAVDEDDVRLAQAAGCAVVHCPRSNEALGCGRFPWETFARHGVDVALGTDSRGSSPDLDVVAEANAALAVHGEKASPRAVVRAGVKGGHRALGLVPPRVGVGSPAGALGAWL